MAALIGIVVCCALVPVVLAIAAFLGFGKKTGTAAEVVNDSDLEESQRSTPEGRRLE